MSTLHKLYYLILILTIATGSNIYAQIFWDEIPTGITAPLSSVSNIDEINAWACGNSGTVIKTSNRGYNWVNLTGNGIPANVTLVNIFGISAVSAVTAGYSGSNTFVFLTSNSGANWTQVFTETGGFINAVWMTSALNGFMQGDPVSGRWSLWKTSNGGVNWDSAGLYLPQVSGEAGWNNSMWVNGISIWFGTGNSRIYYSSTSGSNWAAQSTSPEINSYIVSFDVLIQNTGFTAGATMLKSTNSGTNWTGVTVPGTGNINGISLVNQSTIICARGSSIYTSLTGGIGWITNFTTTSGTYTHLSITRGAISFGPGVMYAAKNNGGITRGNMFVEGVTLISNEVPSEFKLSQNYPNPFNPETKIVFSVPKLNDYNPGSNRAPLVKLVVYNIEGKEIESLHNKVIQPGIYEASWNGSGYASGMYFYRLVISDPSYNGSAGVIYTKTRKMVLVK